jgi:hypothetical protein
VDVVKYQPIWLMFNEVRYDWEEDFGDCWMLGCVI